MLADASARSAGDGEPPPSRCDVTQDPAALLSLPAICDTNGARAVVVYRHPGPLLAFYRRAGWRPDVDVMGWLWRICYGTVLQDLAELPGAVVVDRAELARGGRPGVGRLIDACGLSQGVDAGETIHPDPLEANVDAWRAHLTGQEVDRLEATTQGVWRRLEHVRLA